MVLRTENKVYSTIERWGSFSSSTWLSSHIWKVLGSPTEITKKEVPIAIHSVFLPSSSHLSLCHGARCFSPSLYLMIMVWFTSSPYFSLILFAMALLFCCIVLYLICSHWNSRCFFCRYLFRFCGHNSAPWRSQEMLLGQKYSSKRPRPPYTFQDLQFKQ